MSAGDAGGQPSETIVLEDGRRLSFAQYGDPRGSLLFYFHGMPGSRLEGGVVDQAARECGFRIVGARSSRDGRIRFQARPHPAGMGR